MLRCIICLNDIKNQFTLINCNCNYHYHDKCINKWLAISKSCPVCRKKFNKRRDNKHLMDAIFYDSIDRYNYYRYNEYIL